MKVVVACMSYIWCQKWDESRPKLAQVQVRLFCFGVDSCPVNGCCGWCSKAARQSILTGCYEALYVVVTIVLVVKNIF